MSIPKDAKKVFSGIIFDVFHYEQEMFDGTFKTFEKIKRKPSVDIIAITKDKKILILKEEQPGRDPFFSVVGGTGEEGELPEFTAKRELLEETGMKCNELVLFDIYSHSSRIDHKNYLYIAKNCEKITTQNLDSGEKIKVIECDWEEFKKYVTDKKFRVKDLTFELFKSVYFGKEEEFKNKLFG